MTSRVKDHPQPASEIVLYQTEDGRNRVEAWLDDEIDLGLTHKESLSVRRKGKTE